MKKLCFILIMTTTTSYCFADSSIASPPSPPSPLSSSTPPTLSPPSHPIEDEEGIVYFNPPQNWMLADSSILPKSVKLMVIGKSSTGFPPSINLSSEPFKGTLKEYLKIVKNINSAQGYEWKDLGSIQTQAGTGNLSQVDTKSQWGNVRLMHVILIKNGHVYILTASALRDEFSTFYKDFFNSMRSLKIVKDEYEMITSAQLRTQLKTATDKLKTQWQTLLAQKQHEQPQTDELKIQLFKSQEFQAIWNPFLEMLKQKYSQLGPEWQTLFLQKLEDQLFI